MKVDLFAWQELQLQQKYQTAKGALHIKSSEPVALYAQAEGVEVLVGTGTEIKAQFVQEVEYWVESAGSARVFVHAPGKQFYVPVGEVYTNADRAPDESGTVLEVRKALRQFHLEQQAVRREMRRDMANLRRARAATSPAEQTAEERDPPGDPDEVETEGTQVEAPNTDKKPTKKAEKPKPKAQQSDDDEE